MNAHRALKLKLHAIDPRCHWCGCETIVTNISQMPKGDPHPRMATIDHVYSRLDPRRWVKRQKGERKKVLACYTCNHQRSTQEIENLSKEDLLIRAKGYSLNPRRKPIITQCFDDLNSVLNILNENKII